MSKFENVNSIALVSYFFTIVMTLMICTDPVLQGLALISGACYLTFLKKGKDFHKDFLFYIILFILIAITNPLFSHNGKTPLFFMNSNPVTLEAFLKGFSIAASLVSTVLWLGGVSHIITSEKILQFLGNLSPKLALVFSMALHFVPNLKNQFSKTEQSQRALGIFSCESRFDRLKLKLSTLASVMMFSAETSVETSDSMNARGYGIGHRTSFNRKKLTAFDCLIFLYSISVLIEILMLEFSGKITVEFYPSVSYSCINLVNIIAYVTFGILCFLPIIFEIIGSLRWKYFVSKI